MEIELKDGKVILRKPLAGERNKALIAAEGPNGIKEMVMMIELLPYCILSHPWGAVPVRQALDKLEISEYDKIVQALAELIKPPGDAEKKSEQPSDPKEE